MGCCYFSMKAKFKILAVLCIFILSPLFADRMVSVCLFWNRSVDSVMVSAMSAPLKLKNSIMQSGDTVVLRSGEVVNIESDDYYAISDGRIWRMVSGKCYGRVGKNLYLKIPLRKWIMLTLMGEFPENYPLEALKAGAVVLRSFVLSGKHHNECDVCVGRTVRFFRDRSKFLKNTNRRSKERRSWCWSITIQLFRRLSLRTAAEEQFPLLYCGAAAQNGQLRSWIPTANHIGGNFQQLARNSKVFRNFRLNNGRLNTNTMTQFPGQTLARGFLASPSGRCSLTNSAGERSAVRLLKWSSAGIRCISMASALGIALACVRTARGIWLKKDLHSMKF